MSMNWRSNDASFELAEVVSPEVVVVVELF